MDKEYLVIKSNKHAPHFPTNFRLAMFLALMIWLGDQFSWTASGAAGLAAGVLPFTLNFSQHCYRKVPGKSSAILL